MLDGHHSSQSQRRVKMAPSPRPSCRMKQRLVSKTRAAVGVTSQPFHCELCQVSVNSETQLKQVCRFHPIINIQLMTLPYKYHFIKCAAFVFYTRPVGRLFRFVSLSCPDCIILFQHMNSRRHKERLAGKPVKAKFTPYNKLQPGAVLAVRICHTHTFYFYPWSLSSAYIHKLKKCKRKSVPCTPV